MVTEASDNNVVTISGKVTTELKYSHEIYGEGFYHFFLEVPRLSDSSDNISVTISERLIGSRGLAPGAPVSIEGQFRSYNSFGENGSKLLLTVFARELTYIEDEALAKNSNKIYLNGFICKKPIYRSTPFGREITDLLIAVNRAYNKSDYIPCISWGRNARFCSGLNIGDNIKIWGRIQSRSYQKKMPDGASVARVAYEVSLSKLEMSDAKRQGKDEALPEAAGAQSGAEGLSDVAGGVPVQESAEGFAAVVGGVPVREGAEGFAAVADGIPAQSGAGGFTLQAAAADGLSLQAAADGQKDAYVAGADGLAAQMDGPRSA